MAPPTVSVSPNPHSSTSTITLTGGPFGASQGTSFVYVIDDNAVVTQMTVGTWANTSITVTYPGGYAPTETFTQTFYVAVPATDPDAGSGTSVYDPRAPATHPTTGDPARATPSDTAPRAEATVEPRGHVTADDGNGNEQIAFLTPNGYAAPVARTTSQLRPVGRLMQKALQRQAQMPPYGVPLQGPGNNFN
jgi:hypothetical protein